MFKLKKRVPVEYSPEVQEIMGQVPHWILRWGVVLMFSTLLLLLAGTYFMHYPFMVIAPFTLSTLISPAPLVVNKPGSIKQWLANDGAAVVKGQLIAVIENEANYEDVLTLDSALHTMRVNDDFRNRLNRALSLGTLTSNFTSLQESLDLLDQYQRSTYFQHTKAQLEWEIDQKTDYYHQMLAHRQVKRGEFTLAQKRFRQDSTFYKEGSYGISLFDYETSLKRFFQAKATFISYEATFSEHEATIRNLKQKLLTLTKQHSEEGQNLEKEVKLAFEQLRESIEQWRTENLILAARSGQLTLTRYWSSNQVFKAGETIATIVPKEQTEIIGRAWVSAEGIGKVKPGQTVQIKLSGYPAIEYGLLMG